VWEIDDSFYWIHVCIELPQPLLSPYEEFQKLKNHPSITSLLENGTVLQYDARTLNEGDCLNGEFVIEGLNLKFAPVAGYYWFDGDDMIHGLHIKDGKATYLSGYVKTSRLEQEEYFRGLKLMKLFSDIVTPRKFPINIIAVSV
ncbi:carotenoid 9,10(9',10')-cleavage dioxygenase 1-like protein, partial [Tanacetum coccineum]